MCLLVGSHMIPIQTKQLSQATSAETWPVRINGTELVQVSFSRWLLSPKGSVRRVHLQFLLRPLWMSSCQHTGVN
uniref:Uncharacterized protein n=1 Tax=Arundo donax TaxID=35708 RepID=A0A0A8ZEX2_ARUDO